MAFNVGDVVRVNDTSVLRSGSARIQRVLPRTLSVQDFQEYVVEFSNTPVKGPRFCLYREFELRAHSAGSAAPKMTD